MNKAKKMDSCTELFKSMKISPLCSQYIFSLLLHVVNNKYLFTRSVEVHTHDTRSAKNFHLPIANLTIYQKSAYYTDIKIFTYLPTDRKNVANEIQVFKKTVKGIFSLYLIPFY